MGKIMSNRQVMQQALEALTIYSDAQCSLKGRNAITALKVALEQQQAEPVAWMDKHGHIDHGLDAILKPDGWTPLYTTSPATQPEQEPVGMVKELFTNAAWNRLDAPGSTKVYLVTPPAAQPEQEPTCPKCKAGVLYECVACSSNNYPSKAQRKPLSASEILNMMPSSIPAEHDGALMEFARAIEAKLKEKFNA